MSSIWPVVVQDGKQLEGYSNDSMNDLYKFARDCIKDSCNSCHVEYGDVGDISSVTWITEEGNYLIETSRLKLCETWEDPSSGFSAEGAIDRSNA